MEYNSSEKLPNVHAVLLLGMLWLHLNAVLTDRRSLSGKQPKSANGKSSSCQFSFLDKRNANTEVTEYATFGFSLVYWFPSLSRKLWTSLSASDKDFLSVLAAIIWENSDKQLVLRIMKALPFIHSSTWPSGAKGKWHATDWLYQHMWKNTIFFHVLLQLLSGPKIRKKVCVINIFMQQSDWCKINTLMQHSDWCEIHTPKWQSD